jgi:hypothetical protein
MNRGFLNPYKVKSMNPFGLIIYADWTDNMIMFVVKNGVIA